LGTERYAGNVTQLFSGRNVVVEEMRDDLPGVMLQNLVLDFCVTQAVELGRAVYWHRRHLDGYVFLLAGYRYR
jgi:hypothetical protein